MPKVTGISLEGNELRLVELEGSSKRFRITQAFVVPLQEGGEPQEGGAGEEGAGGRSEKETERERVRSLAAALKESKVQREHAAFVLDGKDAFIRNAKVELKGEEQIRKVIKFEAEGVFQSLDVDDVIVDFLPCKEVEDGTEVLVAAYPKTSLREVLDRLQRAGLDPELVELDAVALFRGAQALGFLDSQEDQVILDLGLTSGRILLVEKGSLAALRTLRFGLEAYLPPEPAREDGEEEPGEEEDGSRAPSGPRRADPESLGAYAERVAREVKRFLAGFAAGMEIRAVLATGKAFLSPGVMEGVSGKLDTEIQVLRPLSGVAHPLEEGEAEILEASVLPALGAALELLGAAEPGMNFRQEEFQFARKFERMKFPLVVCLMLLAFFLVLKYTRTARERWVYEYYLGTPAARGKLARFQLIPRVWNVYVAPSLPAKLARKYKIPPDTVALPQVLSYYKARMDQYLKEQEEKLGFYPDLPPLESGLHVLRAFAWFLEKARSRFSGKVLVTALDLRVGKKKSSRYLAFDLLFWGDSARRDFDEMRRMWDQVCNETRKSPYKESPFLSFVPSSKESPTNPPGGFWRKGNKLMLKAEIPIVSDWPPSGS